MNRQDILRQIQAQSQVAFTQAKIKKLHEAAANVGVTNTSAAGGSGGGGGRMPVTGLSFVVNTTDNLEFRFEFTSTNEPIEFTINWGDGTIHEDSGSGGYYEEDHEYAEIGEYTVTVTFDDPLKILELEFPGTDSDFAGISSITGLQSLSNLESFVADDNHLVSVDLSGLINLTYVDISDCDLPDSSTSSLTSVNLAGCTALEEIRLDDSDFSGGFPNLSGLTALKRIDFDQCGLRGTVDISGLPLLERFDFGGNDELTRLIISSSQPLGGDGELIVEACALTQTAVNNILVALATNGVENGYIDLRDGTNAAPSAPGLAAITTLEDDKGWSVDVNS